jgi:uncharacterized protein
VSNAKLNMNIARAGHALMHSGTQVVTLIEVHSLEGDLIYPLNAVGVVIDSHAGEQGRYVVRFPDGGAAELMERQLMARKHFQRQASSLGHGISAGSDAGELYKYVIYKCVVGSTAYGLDTETSDRDTRGIYLPPAERQWSLAGVPEQLENEQTQEVFWELQKFLTLALKANPNVLECLYTPLVDLVTPLGEELLGMKQIFVSRLVYQTYNGYVLSQFKKMEQDLRNQGTIRWKHAMHLVRLLISGVSILREGVVPVHAGEYRDRLLAIKQGEVPWEEVNKWRLGLHREFAEAYAVTRLPERPDYVGANAFLVKARRCMVEEK